MTTLKIQGPDGGSITSLDQWGAKAPPKGETHWREGYSAYELAKAWVAGPGVPADVRDALDAVPELTGFKPTAPALAEHVTRLDGFRGEGRNHDLVVLGRAAGGPTVLGVEGKSREPFGPLVGKKLEVPEPSNQAARAELLSQALFGRPAADPDISGLRYQLLTAAVGTLIEAQKHECTQAVLLVHELLPAADVESPKVVDNQNDLDAFVRTLGGGAGPFRSHETDHVNGAVSLFVVKVRTVIA